MPTPKSSPNTPPPLSAQLLSRRPPAAPLDSLVSLCFFSFTRSALLSHLCQSRSSFAVLKGEISAFSGVPEIPSQSSGGLSNGSALPGCVPADYWGLDTGDAMQTCPPTLRSGAFSLPQIGSCCWLTPQLNRCGLQEPFTSVITVWTPGWATDVL